MSAAVQINFSPSERTLRQFGYIALVAFSVLGVLAWLERGPFASGLGEARALVSGTLVSLGAAAAMTSLVFPKGNWPLYVGLSVITFPIGFVLSYAILGFLFFCVIAPIGFLLRATGHDPLRRAYDKQAPSYWSDARPARPKTDYFRQF